MKSFNYQTVLSLVLFLVIIVFTQCNNAASDGCIDENKIDLNKPCIEIYAPVCGCDGKTYSNDCFATIAGVLDWKAGECE